MVNDLQSKLTSMQEQQTKMMELLQDISTKLLEEKQSRVNMESELKLVKDQLTQVNEKMSQKKEPELPSEENQSLPNAPLTPPAPVLPSLLLGTSLLRNVDPNKLENCKIIAKGGATVKDLHQEIVKLPAENNFDKLIIVAGSIDIESKDSEDVVKDYEAITVAAAEKTDKIVICSVLPRTDKDLTEKLYKLNEGLKRVCEATGYVFLDMDKIFRLQNGSANTACLLPDGLHLSKFGVDNLMQGCEVPLKKDTASAFSETPYRHEKKIEKMFFKGHESPLSNFYQVQGLFVDGIQFATTEAAYVYQKAIFHGDTKTAQIVKHSQTGIHAKRLGDKIRTTPAWQVKKVDIMDNLIRIKLTICDAARKLLKESEEKQIIEDTANAFWGRGINDLGQNMLGKLWMQYRKKLNIFEPRRNNYSRTWATRDHQPRCYRCNERGHLIEQCRQQERMACWSCGVIGHKQKHCRHATTTFRNFSR